MFEVTMVIDTPSFIYGMIAMVMLEFAAIVIIGWVTTRGGGDGGRET